MMSEMGTANLLVCRSNSSEVEILIQKLEIEKFSGTDQNFG